MSQWISTCVYFFYVSNLLPLKEFLDFIYLIFIKYYLYASFRLNFVWRTSFDRCKAFICNCFERNQHKSEKNVFNVPSRIYLYGGKHYFVLLLLNNTDISSITVIINGIAYDVLTSNISKNQYTDGDKTLISGPQ